MNEEEFRVELNQIRYGIIFTADKEKIEFLKRRTIKKEDELLKVVVGDYIFYAIELKNALYIARKKEILTKIVQKIKEAEFNELKEKLAKILDNQKEDEIISVEVSMLEKYLAGIGARFERRSVLNIEILVLLYKGEERQIAILSNRAYISKRLLINELESHIFTNNIKQLTEEEFKKFIAERYKVIEV